MERGMYFSMPSTPGKIVGLHGKCGAHVDSIGAYLEPGQHLETVKTVGPFGAERGNIWEWDDGIHATIKQIRIVHGSSVVSIRTEYYDHQGSSCWSTAHGGDYEGKTDEIKLDFPDEFLVSISGYYSITHFDDKAIASLTFKSNRRIYGPYGQESGEYFSCPPSYGKIIGLHGTSDSLLNSIGVHVEPISKIKVSERISLFGVGGIGDLWDDGVYSTVRQLIISCGSVVNSICVEYDKNGQSIWSSMHGESAGKKTYAIKLECPDEFLVSLSGFYSADSGSTIIRSLTIESNKRTYGPFGDGDRRKHIRFSLNSEHGRISGFHGASGECLHSIGVYLRPISSLSEYESIKTSKIETGHVWDDGIHTTVRQLIIGSGTMVDSLVVEYDNHGRSAWSSKHGRSNGGKKHMIKLDYPSEFLFSISGCYGQTGHIPSFIGSLKILSNKREYGPFGTSGGSPFSISSAGYKIVGFHGRADHFISTMGVHRQRIATAFGPFGGSGGGEFDDGLHTTVRQIKLSIHGWGLESVQFEYDQNGTPVWSEKRGIAESGKKETIILDYPTEFLTAFSGSYTLVANMLLVVSLTFHSNKKTYGPLGRMSGTPFSVPSNGGKIIGIHGRCGLLLDSIGAYFALADN